VFIGRMIRLGALVCIGYAAGFTLFFAGLFHPAVLNGAWLLSSLLVTAALVLSVRLAILIDREADRLAASNRNTERTTE